MKANTSAKMPQANIPNPREMVWIISDDDWAGDVLVVIEGIMVFANNIRRL
jgi:hypothetical protein